MARLNLLFALMLAFGSYPSIYGVATGDNDKSEKEEKDEKKTEVRLKLMIFLLILRGRSVPG